MISIAVLAGAGLAVHAPHVSAHAVCGSRVYPVTLTMDDPGVADEATIPQILYTRVGANGGPGPGHDTSFQLEYDKRLTDTVGFAINDGWAVNQSDGAKTRFGWDDLTVTAKWSKCLSPDHDFIVGLGVIRAFGHTGTTHTGADTYGSTAPTIYFGKDLEEIGLPALQPLAMTAEFSYPIADKGAKYLPASPAALNAGTPNQVTGGVSVQYSIPFLQAQIKDYGLTEPFAHLMPLVEVTFTSPTTSPGNLRATWTVAPGVIYLRTWYQVGLEALIPANRAAGTNVGFVVQFHVFLDDLYPHGIGAPLAAWFQ